MTFVARHAGGDEDAVELTDEKPLGVDLKFSRNVPARIVVGHDKIERPPKLDHGLFILRAIGTKTKRHWSGQPSPFSSLSTSADSSSSSSSSSSISRRQ